MTGMERGNLDAVPKQEFLRPRERLYRRVSQLTRWKRASTAVSVRRALSAMDKRYTEGPVRGRQQRDFLRNPPAARQQKRPPTADRFQNVALSSTVLRT